MAINEAYQAKQFKLSALQGISDQTLEMHFKLYEGYVKETNRLTEKISDLLKDGQVDQEEMPGYSELTRRLGFEYNGIVLHEYYFGNMTKGGSGDPGKQSAFLKAAEAGFGSYDIWKADFLSIGKMRDTDASVALPLRLGRWRAASEDGLWSCDEQLERVTSVSFVYAEV